MEPETYQIEILHYLNPHLIWIERKDHSSEIVFEQIGIFGLLPLAKVVDGIYGLLVQESEKWALAINAVMKEFFNNYSEFYFLPIHIDRRSSIFNENIHKFGDIYALTQDNERRCLSTILVASGFAKLNDCEFYGKLYSGNIKTKLNSIKANEVVAAIEAKNEAVRKNTTITRAIKQFGNALTTKNLELHNRNQTLDKIGNISQLIEKKTRDLLLCKVEDDVPVGRGCSRMSDTVSERSTSKKSSRSESQQPLTPKNEMPQSSMSKIQKLLQIQKNKADPIEVCKKVEELSIRTLAKHNDNDNESTSTQKNDMIQNYIMSKMFNKKPMFLSNGFAKANKEASAVANKINTIQDTDEEVLADITSKIRPVNLPKTRYLAFGPPMGDVVNYQIKREDEIEKSEKVMKKDEQVVNIDELDATWDDGEVDCNVDVKLSNIDKLKNVVDSETGCNDSFKKLKDRILSKNDNISSAVNRNDNINSGVNDIDNKVAEIAKNDTVNTSERFKKLKDRIQSRNDAKITVVNKIDNKNIDVVDTKVEQNCSESFKRLKDRIQSKRKIELNTGESSNHTDTTTVGEQDRLIKTFLLKKNAKLKTTNTPKVISTNSDKNSNETDSEEDIEKMKAELNLEYNVEIKTKDDKFTEKSEKIEVNVNPYKNLDYGKSVFVDKLVSPILMVHTKDDNLILPYSLLRDIPFKDNIKVSLKKMSVKEPYRLQSVSWYNILRGHSVFMVGAAGCGKTLGYVPAVCNLVMDDLNEIVSVGPICIILCATAKSVCEIANLCNCFLGLDGKVLACYYGIDWTDLTTSVLNGCEILVCTPPMLRKLLMTDLGVDLRRLSTLVLDDFERLSLVYEAELKTIRYYVKEMYKNRVNKRFKVQYIVASRLWCDIMRPLAKKAPSSIVSIVSFQECVLYSKASTSVEFYLKDNKVNSVKDFLSQIDRSKRTVIVCRTNEEVELLEKALSYHNSLFVCNDNMTLHDCHNLNVAWTSYKEPLLGPILLCCDGNLTLLNVTDAQYLIHFSMPELFSMFCKRFAVLNDNYASIFKEQRNDVRIKIMLDENNIEELPKILNFTKRCTSEVPEALDEISRKVLEQKDYEKGKQLVPLCDSMLSLSECSDFWNCNERHAVLKQFDEPKDWMPRDGFITFKILHYDTAVTYSAKLMSHISKSNTVKNYPTNYSMLSLKMGMYFSKEANRKWHGVPKIGDVCAVAVKPNFYTRCQVIKILSYFKGNPQDLLINLIDEEQLDTIRDLHLYHLPDEFKIIETYVVKVRIANIHPQDKDVTYSDLARYQVKKIIDNDEDLYLRGEVALTVGNTIFVNTLEACQDLVSLNETVVKHNLKTELLKSHASAYPDHVTKLKKLCQIGGLEVEFEKPIKVEKGKLERIYRWAYLPKDELVEVIFAGAADPSKFFVVLTKFEKCIRSLISDIKKYVEENQKRLETFAVGDVVLAEFPDDNTYERARIEEVLDDKVYCLFVDRGDMRDVSVDKINYLPDNLIEQLPFQVIECRLIGVQPPATEWSEFSVNWFCDMCLDSHEGLDKIIYLKCFTKEKAEITGGNKYGVLLVDTNTDKDLNINKMMIELNLAREIEDEIKYLDDPIISEPQKFDDDDNGQELVDVPEQNTDHDDKSIVPLNVKDDTSESDIETKPFNKFPGLPIRSVPLVDENISADDFDVNLSGDLAKAFGLNNLISPKVFNNASDSSSQNSEDSSSIKKKSTLSMIKASFKAYDNNSSTPKDSNLNASSVKLTETELNNNFNINSTNTQREYQQQQLKSNITDVINLSHDATNGDILNSTENTEDILTEQKTSPNKRKGSLDDPKIVLDIEKLTPSKSSVYRMFTKPKFRMMTTKNIKIDDLELSQEHANRTKSDLDSDDLSSTDISQDFENKFTEIETVRKPKLIWRQNKNSVTIKIQLIGVEDYNLEIQERSIIFNCNWDDTPYEFKIDLYGVVNVKKSRHANKGQYIQVNLEKLLKKNWINLTKDGQIKNWIVYDVDSIDASSDEEVDQADEGLEALKQQIECHDTDSDDNFEDDITFTYNRQV